MNNPTIINIGNSKKNLVGVKVNKPFKDITFTDVQDIVKNHFGTNLGIKIHGWVNMTPETKQA